MPKIYNYVAIAFLGALVPSPVAGLKQKFQSSGSSGLDFESLSTSRAQKNKARSISTLKILNLRMRNFPSIFKFEPTLNYFLNQIRIVSSFFGVRVPSAV